MRDGGVVVEAAFADALGVSAGDRVSAEAVGRQADARRKAIGAGEWPGPVVPGRRRRGHRRAPPYPEPACLANACMGDANTGLVWLTRADARSLAPQDGSTPYVVNLKLADPAAAPRVRRRAQPAPRRTAGHERLRTAAARPAVLAGHPRRERQPRQEPAAGPADRRLAARPARRGQRRGPRRRPDGRPDPPRRAAQGRRRHTGPGRRRAPRRVRRRRPACRGGRAGGRMAGRSVAHRSQRRPPRQRRCAHRSRCPPSAS